MQSLSLANIILFLAALTFQFVGVFTLPATKGMTEPVPTAVAAITFIVGITLISRLMHNGVNLGFLIVLQSSLLPLTAIAVSALVFKEPTTLLRVCMLVAACLLVFGSDFVPSGGKIAPHSSEAASG